MFLPYFLLLMVGSSRGNPFPNRPYAFAKLDAVCVENKLSCASSIARYICAMKLTEHAEYKTLSASEKLLLVEEIWDELVQHADELPVPSWHKAELDRRYQNYLRNPREGSSWTEVKSRILGK
jgi:putative addiction module component (TIGR02574 family)